MEGDGLPSMICHKCMTKLSIAWEFKMQCENSDAKLRQLCANPPHLQVAHDLDSFNLALRQEQNIYNPSISFSDGLVASDNNSFVSRLITFNSILSSFKVF